MIGNNFHGRLGLDDRNLSHSSEPCLVESLLNEKIISVSCGSIHTIAVTEAGRVYSWGFGEFGALGIGNNVTEYKPVLIQTFVKQNIYISSVACGNKHSMFLSSKPFDIL